MHDSAHAKMNAEADNVPDPKGRKTEAGLRCLPPGRQARGAAGLRTSCVHCVRGKAQAGRGADDTADPEGNVVVSIRGSKFAPQTGSKSEPRYARLPLSVLRDPELSPVARIVYCELALWVFQGATCSLGQRAIAERLGLARNTVADGLEQLEQRGHIEFNRSSHGRRAMYILTSPVFSQKQGRVTEVVSAPSGGRRYASVAGASEVA